MAKPRTIHKASAAPPALLTSHQAEYQHEKAGHVKKSVVNSWPYSMCVWQIPVIAIGFSTASLSVSNAINFGPNSFLRKHSGAGGKPQSARQFSHTRNYSSSCASPVPSKIAHQVSSDTKLRRETDDRKLITVKDSDPSHVYLYICKSQGARRHKVLELVCYYSRSYQSRK